MPDVFISYSTADERLARFVHDHLQTEGISTFLASASLLPGHRWTEEIFGNLQKAKWVIFMASRKACASPYVQQELGAALAGNKTLVPIIWDISPTELPGWVPRHQALNLAGKTIEDLQNEVTAIAQRIREDKRSGVLAVGLLLLGLAAFSK